MTPQTQKAIIARSYGVNPGNLSDEDVCREIERLRRKDKAGTMDDHDIALWAALRLG